MRLCLEILYIVRCYIYNIGNNSAIENYLQIQVGMRVKDLRDREGVSQENFALRIGMDRSHLASIETGRHNVTLLNLAKIARGFGISLADFFRRHRMRTENRALGSWLAHSDNGSAISSFPENFQMREVSTIYPCRQCAIVHRHNRFRFFLERQPLLCSASFVASITRC